MWDLQSLFIKHAREIDRFLRRRGHSPETAADLTQDTFLRILTAVPDEGTADHNPKAYLYQVSRNLSINHARRERLLGTVDLSEDAVAQFADPSPSAETVVYDRQRLKLTEAALGELPERTRVAFELHRLADRTISDVAQELDLSTTRTWALIREAYRHIVTRTAGI
ncbi:MAG: sigma-70 family RNA polymerase sigma factor [Afipia sp.]|nr:sigma-70 family RNA polymerase sigma factor [Afipia sp.]